MIRRMASLVTALVLAAAVVPAAGTTEAAAATKPKLTITTRTETIQTPCGPVRYRAELPVLTGSTAANRARVKSFAGFIRKEILAEFRGASASECRDYWSRITFTTDSSGSMYKGRYVSVMASWHGGDMHGNLRTLNLDLKTGKTVKVTTFVSNKGRVFTWAKCTAFRKLAAYLADQFCPGSPTYTPTVGWTVSTKGIRVYGWGDNALFYSPRIAWSKLVKASYNKAKKHTTKGVPMRSECRRLTGKSTVTVQGGLVVVKTPRADGLDSKSLYGVRTAGKTSGARWNVTLHDPARSPYVSPKRGTVSFASRTSSKATSVSIDVRC